MSNILLKYFPDLTDSQLDLFAQLEDLYYFWNSRINLISRKDIQNLAVHHILHSLSVAKAFSFAPNSDIADAGTGGGLPGIPLAIYFPDCNFFLIDSIGKKINATSQIANALKLKNVTSLQTRIEDINRNFDFVISRAVADLSKLYSWTSSKIKKNISNKNPNGIICLKGGNIDNELMIFKKSNPASVSIKNINEYFLEDYFCDKKIIFIYNAGYPSLSNPCLSQ